LADAMTSCHETPASRQSVGRRQPQPTFTLRDFAHCK
jgi:hypothetical protein